jgi:hypothetical protein
LAPVTTGRKRSRDSATEQFRFLWEKDSVAAAKTASSMAGRLWVGDEEEDVVDGVGVKDVGCRERMELADSRPFVLGAKKE